MYKKIAFLILPIAVLFVMIGVYGFSVSGISNIKNTVMSYESDDTDANYFAALSVYRGEGLYKNASIVYPPGRFLAIAGLFNIMGESIPTYGFYFNFFAPFLYPIFLYILSFQIYSTFISRKYALIFALLPIVIDFTIIRTAQEIHAVSLLFFIVLLTPFKSIKLKNFLLGLLFGLIPLFRIEAAIFTFVALAIAQMSKFKLQKISKLTILGFSVVWVPVLAFIIFKDSFYYFFHDLFYLGLIIQPRTMSHSIQTDHVQLFTAMLIFLLSSGLALFIKTKNKHIRTIAIFSVVSFTSALSRSDEGHLWYGSIWMSFYIGHLLISVMDIKKVFNKPSIIRILLLSVFFFLIGTFLIYVKTPGIFVLTVMLLFIIVSRFSLKINWIIIQVSGLIASVFIFHSISYFTLRYSPLSFNFILPNYGKGLFQDDNGEIAGLKFPEEYVKVLQNIQSEIPADEKYLFIFPDHALYYEFFKQKNPTRYYYLTGERTKNTEAHMISQIEKSNTHYFLVFPDNAEIRKGYAWEWIQKNTIVKNKFILGTDEVHLRIFKK